MLQGSPYIFVLRSALVGLTKLNSSLFGNLEGSPYWNFSFSRRKGVVPGTGPVVLPSGDPGRLPAGTKRPVSCLGSEGIQYLSIFPQQCSFMQDLAIYDTFDAQVNLGSNAR
ncbi:hypothetical protein F2Q68_00034584 [Brassica cretica]|uniref:Uncharacterized protein n=1 Tax=Brassica cretica TaxID=69181 RepID=A0A8S9GWL3_BRACR|nr:hypothetical protein F2Q68_00034584 [Brassica cretica]